LRDDKTIKSNHEDLIIIYSQTSDWDKKDVLSLIDRLRDADKREPLNLFENFDSISEGKCKNITGSTKHYFAGLLEKLHALRVKANKGISFKVSSIEIERKCEKKLRFNIVHESDKSS
jgi:hypothetical protein